MLDDGICGDACIGQGAEDMHMDMNVIRDVLDGHIDNFDSSGDFTFR